MCNYNHALIPRIRPLASFRLFFFFFFSSFSLCSFPFFGWHSPCLLPRPHLQSPPSPLKPPPPATPSASPSPWKLPASAAKRARLRARVWGGKRTLLRCCSWIWGRRVDGGEAAEWRRARSPISCLQFFETGKGGPDCRADGCGTCGRATRAEVIPGRRPQCQKVA